MHKTSKGYRRFKSRIEYFQEDLETVSVFLKNKETLAGTESIFKNVSPKKQAKLFKRQNTSGSREVVLRHLQNTLFVSFIKEMYEEVLIYCAYITDCAAQMSPNANRLVGEQNLNITANDILSQNDYKAVVTLVVGKVFRCIENKKDTLLLISALNDRLNLGVSKETILNAMPYLEARHKFIHSNGMSDDKYKIDYPNVELDSDGFIKLNTTIIKKASTSIKRLVEEYEMRMTENRLFPTEEYE